MQAKNIEAKNQFSGTCPSLCARRAESKFGKNRWPRVKPSAAFGRNQEEGKNIKGQKNRRSK